MKELGESIKALTDEAGGKWSVYLRNLTDGGDFFLNEKEQHYSASVIKLPIMATVFRLFDEGKLSLSEPVLIEREDMVGGAGVLQHLSPGLPMTVYDLTMLMIIQSDNTATNILIDRVTREEIVKTMDIVGMEHSQFYNKLMIVPAELEGANKVTAADMGLFLEKLAHGKISSLYACEQMVEIMKRQQIHYMTEHLPDGDGRFVGEEGAWEFASKTGSVTDLRHDLGLFYAKGKTYVTVIMASECHHLKSLPVIAQIGELIYQHIEREG